MYPSGPWRGYWEQHGYGRQPMRGLVFRLSEGLIEGEGTDIVGAFTFSGQYDSDGFVTMVKQYVGQHQVLYQGRYDGEGTISGLWSIGQWDSGAFALRPEAFDVAEDAPILSISASPPAQKARPRPLPVGEPSSAD